MFAEATLMSGWILFMLLLLLLDNVSNLTGGLTECLPWGANVFPSVTAQLTDFFRDYYLTIGV